METRTRTRTCTQTPTLETSLVEWKPDWTKIQAVSFPCLGNFLSGMETYQNCLFFGDDILLGNFLSGMETDPFAFLSLRRPCLGNFLSGMETEKENPGQPDWVGPWKLP